MARKFAKERLTSALELEFETHFARFLMPTIRGTDQGSKKRYAGLIQEGDTQRMVFKGLETVRTDWTPLAQQFQQTLYLRVFRNEPYQDYVRDTIASLMAGELDDQLVYRKRLRRPRPNINVTFLPTYAPRGWRMKRTFAGAVRRSIRTGERSNTSGPLTARNPLITSSLRLITITT